MLASARIGPRPAAGSAGGRHRIIRAPPSRAVIEHAWLVPLGFAAGLLGSMIGLGGGIVMVPALIFAGVSPAAAAGTSLFAAFTNAAASTVTYARQRRIDYAAGARLGLMSVPGTVVGAYAAAEASPAAFKALFGAVLVASAAYMLLGGRIAGGRRAGAAPSGAAAMLGVAGASFGAGVVSSFFGIGGGAVFVPLMIALMCMSMRRAAPTSQFILLFASLSGLAVHAALGHTALQMALMLGIGAFAGGLAGARLSLSVGESRLAMLAAAAIAALAAKMFYDAAASGAGAPA